MEIRHEGVEEMQMSNLGSELLKSLGEALAHAERKRTRTRVHKAPVKLADTQKTRREPEAVVRALKPG